MLFLWEALRQKKEMMYFSPHTSIDVSNRHYFIPAEDSCAKWRNSHLFDEYHRKYFGRRFPSKVKVHIQWPPYLYQEKFPTLLGDETSWHIAISIPDHSFPRAKFGYWLSVKKMLNLYFCEALAKRSGIWLWKIFLKILKDLKINSTEKRTWFIAAEYY